jgi:hypothetical protein
MKLLVSAIAALLVAVPALASSKQAKLDKISWAEIEAQKATYFVNAPSVGFLGTNGGTFFKRLLTVDGKTNVCVAGDQLYGGVSKVCKQWENRNDNGTEKCLKYASTELYAPISGTRTLCVKWDNEDRQSKCLKNIDVDYTIDTNVKAAVLHQPSMDEDDNGTGASQKGFIGYKSRQLPACN